MVRSKGGAKKVGTLPYNEYMVLRSMSKYPPPSYSEVEGQRAVDLQDNPVSKRQNGFHKVSAEEDDDAPTIIITSGCSMFPRCRYIVFCTGVLLMCLLSVLLVHLLFPYPIPASCTIKWKFGEPCTYTMQKFRSQILAWSTYSNCGQHGSRCLYALMVPKPEENNIIKALHFGPNLKAQEAIQIDFHEINRTCWATGKSTSNEWFRIFDYGINYCNLHNLVTGIGAAQSPKFFQLASSAVCTQYNMAVCE